MTWPWFRIDVEDDTMRPTYLPGDRVLVRRRCRKLRAGDVVVYRRQPDDELVLGRVVEARDQALPTLAGDNPARGAVSRDDQHVPRTQIAGRVVAHLSAAVRPARKTYS